MQLNNVLQVLIDGIVVGSSYGLASAGMGLVFGVAKRFHFAFAITLVLGAYIAISLRSHGVPTYLAIVIGVLIAAVIDMGIERLVYQPLVRSATSAYAALLAVFVSSLGLVIMGENIINWIWGPADRFLTPGFSNKTISLGDQVTLSTLDIFIIGVSAVVVVALWVLWRFAKYGRAMQAVKENPDMAMAVGINPYSTYVIAFALGSMAVAIAGILFTMQGSVTPESGQNAILLVFVAVFLAGTHSSPLRFGIAGLIIGVLQQAPQIWINADWSPVIPFFVLFVYICVIAYMPSRGISTAGRGISSRKKLPVEKPQIDEKVPTAAN